MLPSQLNGSPKRAGPFIRPPSSASPSSSKHARAKSAAMGLNDRGETGGHFRNNSVSQISSSEPAGPLLRDRMSPFKNNASSSTFAPEFIKTEELRRGADQIRGLEGDNDFSGNKYVWLKDPKRAFVRGLVLEEQGNGRLLVQSDDGDVGRILITFAPATTGLHESIATRSGCGSSRQGQPGQV